jgi:hypothetical protein
MLPKVGQAVQYFPGGGAAAKAAQVVSVDIAEDPDPAKRVVTTRLAVLEYVPAQPGTPYTDAEGHEHTPPGIAERVQLIPVTAPYGQPGKTDGPFWAPAE